MKRISLLIVLVLIVVNITYSQSFQTDQEAKTAVSKLDFIVGNWEGKGWMMGQDGKRHEFDQTEKIQFKLDSTAILIEGVGMTVGVVTHNAMAIVSFNKEENNYIFQSYLQNGRKGEFKAELIEDKFYWYPNENLRYVIEINNSGQWFETGEYNRQGNWLQFFEMTLDKVN